MSESLKKLGKYQIQGILGKGMMGVVYRGLDPDIQRPVAIKTLKPQAENKDEILARFKREAQSAGILSHQNIVGIYDYGEDDENNPYIAMEYVDGKDLESIKKVVFGYQIEEKVQIISQVLDALQFAHSKGIVHRDIKPANIMLLPDKIAKVADFGIARIRDSNMTQMGAVLGTPAFMSPEQVMGQRVEGSSDLFSTAVVLYSLLTGVNPFRSNSPAEIMQNILGKEVAPPSEVNPSVPKTFDLLMEVALNKSADQRFEDASDFKNNLQEANRQAPKKNIFSLFNKNKKVEVENDFDDRTVLDVDDLVNIESAITAENNTLIIPKDDDTELPDDEEIETIIFKKEDVENKQKVTKIDRFEIVHELGKGSQGVVYLAFDPSLQRQVAVKTLAEDLDENSKQQLMHEARMVSRLNHRNIIPVFEVGEVGNTPYLVFEYSEGMSLRSILSQEKKLPTQRAIKIIIDILNALMFAHEQEVLHCDLNPSNIMIAPNDIPKIMDFGVSQKNSVEEENNIEAWGTPKYMAPEYFNDGKIGFQADLFAVGMTLFELLSGETAIEENDVNRVIFLMAQGELRALQDLMPDVDESLNDIVMKFLEKEPYLRYSSAKNAMDTLQKYIDQTEEKLSEDEKKAKSTVDFMLNRINRKQDFPTISQHIVEINNLAEKGDHWSSDKLVEIISRDYSLTSKILRLVNVTTKYAETDGEITSIQKAVTILGFEKVHQISLGMFLFDHIKSKKKSKQLRNIMLRSFASSMVARQLSMMIHSKNEEEAFICALFYQLGKVLCIYYFNQEYKEIKALISDQKMSEEDACLKVMDATYSQLAKAVCQTWNLPAKIINGITRMPADDIPEPKTETEFINSIAGFSNELCDCIEMTKKGNKLQLIKFLRERYQKCLPIDEKAIAILIESLVIGIREQASILGFDDLDNVKFIKRLNVWSEELEEELHVTRDAELTGGISNEIMNQDSESRKQWALIKGIREINRSIRDNDPIGLILPKILTIVHLALDCQRVYVCQASKMKVTAIYSLGKDSEQYLKNFVFKIERKADIFNECLLFRKEIHLENAFDLRALKFIPEWYKNSINAKAVSLYPIVSDNIVLGILYVDYDAPPVIREYERLFISAFCNQIAFAIRKLNLKLKLK